MAENKDKKVLNVPNIRFKEFKEEWEKCRLDKVATIVGGGTPDTNNSVFWNGSIQWFTPSEVGKNKYISHSIRKISEEGLKKSSAKLLPIGTILLSSRATIGECSINTIECTTNQGFESLIINQDNYNEFFFYLIQTKRKELIRKSCGSTFLEISSNEIKKINITKPSRKEQEKIASFLSLIDERIATQNKIIDKLESLIKGIRKDIFKRLRKDFGFNSVIGSVLKYEQPQQYIVNDTDYTTAGIPVLTANKAFILGYTTEKQGIYDKGDCIIFDDFTLDCKCVNFPFKVKSSAIKILTAQSNAVLRYTFEYLKYINLSTEEHKRHYIAEVQNENFILPDTQTIESIARLFSLLTLQKDNAYKQKELFESEKQYLLRQMFI